LTAGKGTFAADGQSVYVHYIDYTIPYLEDIINNISPQGSLMPIKESFLSRSLYNKRAIPFNLIYSITIPITYGVVGTIVEEYSSFKDSPVIQITPNLGSLFFAFPSNFFVEEDKILPLFDVSQQPFIYADDRYYLKFAFHEGNNNTFTLSLTNGATSLDLTTVDFCVIKFSIYAPILKQKPYNLFWGTHHE